MDEPIDVKMKFPVMVPVVPSGEVFIFKDEERGSVGVPVFNFDEASDWFFDNRGIPPLPVIEVQSRAQLREILECQKARGCEFVAFGAMEYRDDFKAYPISEVLASLGEP